MSKRDQIVTPMVSYENGDAMMNWLIEAFGFTEKARWIDNGRLTHGELEVGGDTIMIASPTPQYQSPITVRAGYPPAAEWSSVPYIINGVLVRITDIESHFIHAKNRGATILSEIEYGFPGPRYRAEDPEGQRWFFIQT